MKNNLEMIKSALAVSVAFNLLIGGVLSSHADGIAYYLNSGGYSVAEGSSISGTVGMQEIPSEYDTDMSWEDHFTTPVSDSFEILGTGSHPITSSDLVNGSYFGPWSPNSYSVTWPADYYGLEGFGIATKSNSSLDYDHTGTISLYNIYGSSGPETANVTLLNTASIMNIAINEGGTFYHSTEIMRGGDPETATVSIIRGDTLNTRTVNYTIGGDAESGRDYSASLSGSVTINAGSSNVDIPITAVTGASIVGTKVLTLTLSSGAYGINTNNSTVTIAILPNAPMIDVTAPSFYASQNGEYSGQFTITRSGELNNSVTANLTIGGTAVAGTDYTALPPSVTFAPNQTSTNLNVSVINPNLTAAKTIVLSLDTNSAYFPGLYTNAVVTILPNSSTTNSVASPAGRYWRGSGSDPTYWSMVVPLDFESGTVYSDLDGNCSTLYSNLTSWSSQTLYHYNATNSLPQTNVANRIAFNNPIVAFGERVGGTPLYFNQPYNFGIYAGNPVLSNQPVVVQAFYRTNYQLAGSVSIYPPSLSNTNAWTSYVTNGFQITTNAFGLTTVLSGAPTLNWGDISLGAYVLTHTADSQATNYYYVVEIAGNPANQSDPMVIDGNGDMAPSLLYSLEFEPRPPWRSVFLDQPHFAGHPLPPFYSGMTLDEMLTNAPPVTNTVSSSFTDATNLDDSPELRRSPILDNFVASMGDDPIALANYVINQIGLTDPIAYNDDGNVAENSINPPGVTRDAQAVFLEKEGSPVEQCALLVYLLRQAGVPAVYEFAPHNGLMMLDARLSQMLKFQVQGSFNEAGQLYTTNTMIPVNYPWVAAYIGTNWVHIFPWLKDYEINEGLNLWDEMPTNYSSAFPWVRDYIYGDTNLLSLAVDGDDTPLTIFPRFLQQTLLQNHPGISVDDIGVQILNRQHYYSRWQDFPRPTWVTNVSTSIESLSSGDITNVDPALTNIFDTLDVEIYSLTDPTKDIQTGNMRLCDLHNREFYIHQFMTNGNVQLNLVLMPFRAGITNQYSFTNDPSLLSKEVLSMTFDQYDYNLGVRFRFHRYQAISPAYAIDPSLAFLGLNATRDIDVERPLRVGDQAAICLDYGQVTPQMLNVDAQNLWQMENTLRANPSQTNSISPDVYEGALMYLAGMTYYEKISEFSQLDEQLNKFNVLSFLGAGLSKIIPARNSYGDLTNGTDPVLPAVDMFLQETALVGNGTLHPDSGQPYLTAQENYALLALADGSAEEHQVLDDFYQQTNSISTVRLLQMAQTQGAGIVPLNVYNYTAKGQATYQSEQLQNWDPDMWSQVVAAFQEPDSYGYVNAFITPGPIANSAYKGMGALIMGWDNWAALISPDSLNGGFGGQDFPPDTVAPANTVNYSLNDNNGDYSIGLTKAASQSTLMPDEVAAFNAASVASQISSGNYVFDQFDTTYANYAALLLGLASGTSSSAIAQDFATSDQNGFLGTPNDAGAQVGAKVGDPVNNITGEFYVQATDLQLPGPMPLALHRNYSSQNLADNQFGYGWKLSIMPYLSISVGGTNIYAADMDGAVLAYVQSATNSNLWTPTLAANPQLDNNTTAGVGGLVNRLHDYILRSTDGSVTNYTLYGADGSVRTFQFMDFSSGTIINARPYLLKWSDNRGNYYTFSYDTNSADANFGQMTRIQCSNGNYLGFNYDIYGHIFDAYTGDGRWVYYTYDNFGDLTKVTLPDGSTRSYQYLHGTQSVTNNGVVTQQPYSTHLIIEEDKPDGRELVNQYDDQRRVTNQLSTAGIDLTPIRTATFTYENNFNLTNSYTNGVTGHTLVIDGNGNTNRYDYTNSLITKITDPLGQTIQQFWYPDDATAPGYPRSVEERIDKRGLISQYQYDSNGNVTNTVITGDLSGDGIMTQTATNTAIYNTNSLPLRITDPVGNGVAYVYDPTFNFLPQQIIRFAGSTSVSTNFMYYSDATNVVVNGSTTQTNEAFGVLTRQIRAYGSSDAATNDMMYDGHGFLTESIAYTGTSDPNVTNYFFYNERGDQVFAEDALGAYTYSEYDPMNRPTVRENVDEFGNLLSWNLIYYNENGEVSWTDGPRYNPEDYVFYDYDGAGRVTTEIHWRSEAKSDGTGVEAPSGYNLYAQTFYQYDPLGNLILKVDPRGAETTNTYDALCRLVQTKHLDTNGTTVLSTEGYGYEPGGLVKYFTNALGGVTTTLYTSTGKLEFRSYPNGSTNAWRYYLDGRIKKTIQRNGAYWLTTYNDADRLTTHVFYSAANVPEATNSTQLDRRGNIMEQVDAGNNTFTATYDGLNREKTAAGPAIPTVSLEGQGTDPTSPGYYVTNILQQAVTNYYGLADRVVTNINALGEMKVTTLDAIGRATSTKVFNSDDTLARETYTSYSPDHNSITVTDGSGNGAISNTIYTDNDGHTVLSVAYPSPGTLDYTLKRYDLAGNLEHQEHDTFANSTNGTVTQWTFADYTHDGLNRLTSQEDRAGAETFFAYDAMNDLTNRTMPGDLQWDATYNNAGQVLQDSLVGTSGSSTRTDSYTYYTNTSPFAGLLDTKTNGRGLVSTHSYDDWLRPTSITRTLSLNFAIPPVQILSPPPPSTTNTFPNVDYNHLDTFYSYDARGYTTNITEQYTGSANGSDPKVISRTYDPYGQLASETITINGEPFSTASQTWDAAGRRTGLTINGATYNFGWNADYNLTYAADPTGSGGYTFDTAGLLTTRVVGSKTTTITSRDGEGRPYTIDTDIGDTRELTESLSYYGDGLLSDDTLYRSDDFTDSRVYGYAPLSRRLTYEQLNLNDSTTWTNQFTYDGGNQYGPGALTQMGVPNPDSADWSANVSSFCSVNTETNTVVNYPAYGRLNGQATVTAFLDNEPLSVSINNTGDTNWPYQWSTKMELTPGAHQLKVAALHPSGFYTAYATNSFTNNFAYETDSIGRDGSGNVERRWWYNASGVMTRSEFLYYDTENRLITVFDYYDNNLNGFYWHAEYDGLGRRLLTECYPLTDGVILNGVHPTIIKQYYDPQAEFLELGVRVNNAQTQWKLYGPDSDGIYGGENGTGGLDAISPYLNLFNPVISDARGDVLAEVTNGVVAWSPSRPTGYGAVPGYRPVALGHGADLAQASAWRGHWPDITGYYNIGRRTYDPVAGMWLSYDPTWNDRDPNYLTFCGGDPINYFDSNGRFSRSEYQNQGQSLQGMYNSFVGAYGELVNGAANDTINYLFNNSSAFRSEEESLFGPAENSYGQYGSGISYNELPESVRLGIIEQVAGGNFQSSFSYSGPSIWNVAAAANYYNQVSANGLNQGGLAGYSQFAAGQVGEGLLDFFGATSVQQSASRSGAAAGLGQRGAALGWGAFTVASVAMNAIPGGGKTANLVEEEGVRVLAAGGTAMRNVVQFQGMEVRAVRNLSHVDESTLRAMAEQGFAAENVSGDKLILHHMNQNPAGPLVEMPSEYHSIANELQHPFGNTAGAGLTTEQRAAFDAWRQNYWRARATTELQRRGL